MNKIGKYTISEVKPRIFFLKFKRNYDLCMQFLRYQEFYESPNPKFRNHQFELLDFMDWYSHQYGNGCFTYPSDWAGFNIFGDIIKRVWDLGISDRNLYDYEMRDLYRKFLEKYPDGRFYIIGAEDHPDAETTMRHEVAHGLYFISSDYKKKMAQLVKQLKKPFYKKICDALKKKGYTPKVYMDECQAYLSTGLPKSFGVPLKKENLLFVNVFNEYFNK